MGSPTSSSSRNKLASPGLGPYAGDPVQPTHWTTVAPSWSDDTCVLDMDNFAKTLSAIKAKGVRPDLLGSIISGYASKWLPELSSREAGAGSGSAAGPSPRSTTAAWLKKRFFVEALVGMLPVERGAVPCDFLLRLLRAASMAGAAPACLADLEARAARQLEQASLGELMIPAFSHTCGTLLDVGLVLRLVRRFVGPGLAERSGAAAAVKVAKLVDSYLAETAPDAGLSVPEFEELARALPGYARASDDGLYRAIDTYIKAHPSTTKQERKDLCRLIDPRKLSSDASLHAALNERLPVRTAIQVLFSEQSRLGRFTDQWGGSFSRLRSPNSALDAPGRCPSKREALAQQQEMLRLRDDVARLQLQCHNLQAQLDRIASEKKKKKKKKKGFFRWSSFSFLGTDAVEKMESYEVGSGRLTPMAVKKAVLEPGRAAPSKWRNSMS